MIRLDCNKTKKLCFLRRTTGAPIIIPLPGSPNGTLTSPAFIFKARRSTEEAAGRLLMGGAQKGQRQELEEELVVLAEGCLCSLLSPLSGWVMINRDPDEKPAAGPAHLRQHPTGLGPLKQGGKGGAMKPTFGPLLLNGPLGTCSKPPTRCM